MTRWIQSESEICPRGQSPPTPGSTDLLAVLRRRLVDDRVVVSERVVQRPPGGLLDGPPWRRPPVQHLANPRLHHVPATKEGRTPPVAVLGQPQLISVALHPDDNGAEAGPRIEPRVKGHQLRD